MPIATPQGTLDFKSVDTVTFVGASSNTVIDTTTGSLGVGVDGNGPTSNLHVVGHTRLEGDINMLHTSNTASIKLNSNVVTEFPRSKKLIKYPRVNLTQNALNNGYAAEASTENNGTSSGQAYRVFDGSANGERGYHSIATMYTSGSTYNGTASITDARGTQHQGEWIKLQMPTTEKMKLSGFSFSPRVGNYYHRVPYKGVFLGSTDGIGTNWYPIHYFDNVAGSELTTVSRTFENTTNDYYNHIALVVYEVGPNATYGDVLNFAEMELFGTPEYDPDAHGTDVVVKSVPNVPNTDWLDIYIDGQDYSTMPSGNGSVLDKSTNNRHGTPSNVTFNSTWKAFEIESASTSNITIPFNSTGGEYVHTIALWFLMDTTSGGNRCIFTIRGSESPGKQIALIVNQDSTSVGFKYDFYSGDVRYHDPSVVANKWMHVALTYSGGDNSVTSKEIYLNGVRLGVTASNSTALNLTGSENLLIGGDLNSGNASFEGMVANFRMFNRVLSKDDIYQLYAYQKEYFGHGDLGMTLKAGRLGIGTSEPRAALDVRGDVHISGSLRKTRARMIRLEAGAKHFTLDGWQTYVSYGETWTAYSSDPLYSVSITGDYVSGARAINYRIAVQNQRTDEVKYFPSSSGWVKYHYVDNTRLDGHGYLGIMSGLTLGDSYRVQLEVDPNSTNDYQWHYTYGTITGLVWD